MVQRPMCQKNVPQAFPRDTQNPSKIDLGPLGTLRGQRPPKALQGTLGISKLTPGPSKAPKWMPQSLVSHKWIIQLINQWINESISQWFKESMNQWINESINQWTNESMNQCINEPMNPWINESMNQWINGAGGRGRSPSYISATVL